MRNTVERRKLTPPQIAAQFGISADKVVAWIRSGELPAMNVATRANGRPRWVVDVDDLSDFERRRAAVVKPRAKRKRRPAGLVKEYF